MEEQTFVSGNHEGKVQTDQPKTSESSDAEAKPVSTMNRAELEAYATDHGIDNPDDKEQFPNMDALRDAIADVDDDGGTD